MSDIIRNRARKTGIRAVIVASGLGLLGTLPAATAQPQQPAEPQPPAQPAAPQEPAESAEQREIDTELERAREELADARRNLEQAAREVARLSSEAVSPVVRDVRRQWARAGQRALLGLSIENENGVVRVVGVSPDGPADEAGIMTGDVILRIDGRALEGNGGPARVLVRRLSDIEPGTSVELRIRRDGEERDVAVMTRDAAAFPFRAPRRLVDELRDFDFDFDFGSFGAPGRWESMELVTLSEDLGRYFGTSAGLLVLSAPDDDSLGLRDGDVILEINGRTPSSPEHAMRILSSFEPGETLRMTVMRDRRRETLEVPIPSEEDAQPDPR